MAEGSEHEECSFTVDKSYNRIALAAANWVEWPLKEFAPEGSTAGAVSQHIERLEQMV